MDLIVTPRPVKVSKFILIPAEPFLRDFRLFPMWIGKLSQSDRAEKVKKYLEKKRKRKFGYHVRYECRKSLAVERRRVNGRFVKSNSRKSTEDEESMYIDGKEA